MGMLGYLFPLCRTPLRLRLEESMKRRQSEGLCGKPRDVNKPGMFMQLHNLFSMSKKEARSLFRFLKLVILTSSWTRFHCLSREAKSSDCCFDRYKSRARSFRYSWRDSVWLIATCSWICRLNIFQRYWFGRILPWRHFFIWWWKKIFIYWRCGYRKIIWMGNRCHSRSKIGIFDLSPRRCIETSYIS